jgi:hypothetical protein
MTPERSIDQTLKSLYTVQEDWYEIQQILKEYYIKDFICQKKKKEN